ncbi:MAG: hypothetical protein M1838_003409 [Thelocarpon superellum]|nr:MAG: hypothetical protein M1838_003409 [Thelocarpon superellum]
MGASPPAAQGRKPSRRDEVAPPTDSKRSPHPAGKGHLSSPSLSSPTQRRASTYLSYQQRQQRPQQWRPEESQPELKKKRVLYAHPNVTFEMQGPVPPTMALSTMALVPTPLFEDAASSFKSRTLRRLQVLPQLDTGVVSHDDGPEDRRAGRYNPVKQKARRAPVALKSMLGPIEDRRQISSAPLVEAGAETKAETEPEEETETETETDSRTLVDDFLSELHLEAAELHLEAAELHYQEAKAHPKPMAKVGGSVTRREESAFKPGERGA